MSRNKVLVVILSHADTEDKIEILIESINSIKKQNYDILISSHINIPDYINDMVDYFIYDKENELINDDISQIFIWMKAVGYEHHYPIKNYHAYAVLELIKNASFFAESKGYENVHFINYDYVINDENILLEHNKLLVDNDIISYDWTNYGGLNSKYITSGFFSVRNKNFLNLIKNIKTKEDYHKHSRPIFEEFLYDYVINNSDMKVYHLPVSILFDNLPPDEIKKSTTNKIDTKSLLDNHIINNFDNENLNQKLYLYLIKDEDNNYYILIRFDFKILKVNFKIGDIEYDFYTNPGINLIPIKFEQLEKNILIKILGNDNIVERQINQFTIPAYCVITEKSYIQDIFKVGSLNKKYTIEKYCNDATKRYDLINFLINEYDFKDYLEIGVNDGSCIRKINIENKDGVDPSPNSEIGFGDPVPEINYQVTSDYFFDNYAYKKYDIIFIDGLHHSDQVDKDIQNSLRYLNDGGFILLHDCNPPEYEVQLVPRQTGIWNGDVWKSIVKLRCTDPSLEINVVDTDWGVGVIRRGNSEIYTKNNLNECLEWDYLDLNRDELLNIISVDEFYNKNKNEKYEKELFT